ncbi:putative ADP-ribosylglycohydrolase [Prevotella sp. CAG:5226]|nr:putative ADP-ribosylglycohydrolase [Prevotella sp. CAG:5226]
MEHKTIDRFRGCLYGQAIGDALGLGTEFMTDEDIAWKYPHGHRGAEKSVAPTDYSTSLWRKIHRIHPNRLRGSGVGCVRCM